MKTSIASLAASLVLVAALTAGGAAANGSPYSPGLAGWEGVLGSNGAVRFVTMGAGGGTVVAAIRARGGQVVTSRLVRGQYGVPIVAYDGTTGGVSGDGRTLVLGSYGPLPGSKGSTRFLTLSTRTLRLIRALELRGSWSYDAISPLGSRLYLVEHLSAGPSPRYRVRVLDLASGRLLPQSVIDKAASAAIMRGQPATRASTDDGRWAYTLYARPRHAPFIHALDTANRQAYCIDLPLKLGRNEQMALRLTLSDDGRELAVLHRGDSIAAMDTKTFVVRGEG